MCIPIPHLCPYSPCVCAHSSVFVPTPSVCLHSPCLSPLPMCVPTPRICPHFICISFLCKFHIIFLCISLLRMCPYSMYISSPCKSYILFPCVSQLRLCPYSSCVSLLPVCVPIPRVCPHSPCMSSLLMCVPTPCVPSLFVSYVFLLTICPPTYQASYRFFIYYLIYNKQPVKFIKTAQIIIHVQFTRPGAGLFPL